MDIYNSRCITYHPLGNYLTAMSNYNQVVAKDTQFLAPINNIGFIKYEQGEKETAIQE